MLALPHNLVDLVLQERAEAGGSQQVSVNPDASEIHLPFQKVSLTRVNWTPA